MLDSGNNWELRVDLDCRWALQELLIGYPWSSFSVHMILLLVRKFVFPSIVETNLRPEAVLVSQQSKTLVAIELTVPWEEICEKAHERKGFKYYTQT